LRHYPQATAFALAKTEIGVRLPASSRTLANRARTKSPLNAETRLNQFLGSGPTNGVFDQRRPALKPELFPNVEAVGLDGFRA